MKVRFILMMAAFGMVPSGFGQQPQSGGFLQQNPAIVNRYFPHLVQETNAVTAELQAEKAREETFDLKFPGGPPELLVEIIGERFQRMNKPLPNILVSPPAVETQIPAFQLQNVTLADIFEALNNLAGPGEARWELSGSKAPIWVLNPAQTSYGVGLPQPGFPGGGIGIDPLTGAPIPPRSTRTISIFPLAKYLEDYRIEDITTAIQTAWEMMPEKAMANLKFHKDTKLLIAVGAREQLALIEQILKSLENQPKQPEMIDIAVPEAKSETPKQTR